MFSNMIQEKEHLVSDNNNNEKPNTTKPNRSSKSNAGPTPFHRAFKKITQPQQRFKWLIYENNGSFDGWFDWLPLWMRVGYWSPFVVSSLVVFYSAFFYLKPRPLEFAATVLDHYRFEEEEDAHHKHNYFMGMPVPTVIDLGIFLWGIFVMVYGRVSLGSIRSFFVSFTGWSWLLITSRAGFEYAAWITSTSTTHNQHNNQQLATKLATIGSSLRFVTIANATVVCTIWNLVLLPIICFKSIPAGEKRRKFLKFNFGFFMTNIHIVNFPLAFVNILSGSRVRLFTLSGELFIIIRECISGCMSYECVHASRFIVAFF